MIEYATNASPYDDDREREDVKAFNTERNRMDDEQAASIVARRLGRYLKPLDLQDEGEFCRDEAKRYRSRGAHKSAEPYAIASAALLEASEQMKRGAA